MWTPYGDDEEALGEALLQVRAEGHTAVMRGVEFAEERYHRERDFKKRQTKE